MFKNQFIGFDFAEFERCLTEKVSIFSVKKSVTKEAIFSIISRANAIFDKNCWKNILVAMVCYKESDFSISDYQQIMEIVGTNFDYHEDDPWKCVFGPLSLTGRDVDLYRLALIINIKDEMISTLDGLGF